MLAEILDALQKPKEWAWQGVHSLLGGEGDAPRNGQELMAHLGMDTESPWTKALGFGADVLGDPLTYAAPLVGKAAGGLARLGGVAADALTGSGAPGVANLLAARRGFGAAKGITAAAGPEFAEAAAALRPSGAGVLKDVIKPRPLVGVLAKTTGAVPFEQQAALQRGGLSQIAGQLGEFGIAGAYSPEAKMAYLAAESDPLARAATQRHELMHGLIHQAAGGAPLNFPARLAGRMTYSGQPFQEGLGMILNEAIAHGAESRGLSNQAMGALSFLTNPHPDYVRRAFMLSPDAANLWQGFQGASRAAPWALAAGVPVAAGVYMGMGQ
jgi:hypothetical protein